MWLLKEVSYIKKVVLLITSVIVLAFLSLVLINPKLEIDVKNDIKLNEINFMDFQKINSDVFIKSNGKTQLLLKINSSFSVEINKYSLLISTRENNITDTTNLEKYHLIEILSGKLKTVYYNDVLIYKK
jgi:hypothetical protein